MFCPKCHSIMFLKDEMFECRKCGYSQSPERAETFAPRRKKKEAVVIDEKEAPTLPTAKVECPACNHREAFWVLKQTRASDEPETRIYTCKACGNRWREY